MTARLLSLICAFFWCVLPAVCQPADTFEYGLRPPLSVFDPDGLLDPRVVKEISDPLVEIYKNEGIDVLVIVQKNLEGAPPEHVARRFAKAWCTAPIHCVVLHVPGDKGSPWIIPGGKLVDLIQPDQIEKTVIDAEHRAAREAKESDKVRASSTEAADMLRYWTNNVINHSEIVRTERTKLRTQLENNSRLWKISLLLGAIALIPITAGLTFLVFMLRKRGPRRFPNRAWQLRLGAPYSGGNRAIAKIANPS